MINFADVQLERVLKDFVEDLLKENFRVFVCEKSPTFCKYVKDDNIGYVQTNRYKTGLDFSTVHKANRDIGTGFQVASDVVKPTIEMAEQAFMLAPHWCSSSRLSSVVKYKSWDQYLKENTILKYVEVVL